jgi:hypothetical protein
MRVERARTALSCLHTAPIGVFFGQFRCARRGLKAIPELVQQWQ